MMLIHCGDCLKIMPTLDENSIDAIVTDPPYGLSFMGKDWDHGVPGEHFWREALRIAKPGAHLLAFGGTRTFHRLTCSIEDAGWEMRDCIMWVYGSGFPKSLDVSKAIDKAAGAEGTFGAPKSAAHAGWIDRGRMRGAEGHDGWQSPWMQDAEAVDRNARRHEPATDAARQWSGWGTALKPAWEPIILARKPLAGTVAGNVQKYGTGGINIDGCRIKFVSNEDMNSAAAAAAAAMRASTDQNTGRNSYGKFNNGADSIEPYLANINKGRWPANVIHDGSDEVMAGFPETSSGARNGTGKKKFSCEASHGSAARFFYCAKASREDRNEGCEIFKKKMLRWSSGEQSPGTFQSDGTDKYANNFHPTVKPTDLMRYLCRLVTPPGGVVLDPFMGSGSTGKAAVLEGFEFVGIELNAEYCQIARARIEAAGAQMRMAL
jgi:DNA modification methylase